MVEPTFQSVALGFAAAAKGLKALKDLVSGDARAQVAALYDVILASQASAMEAHLKQTAMIDRIRELEEEIARMKAWDKQKERYKLARPWPGAAFVLYVLKESCKESEEAHWICTKCYDDGRRTILQPRDDKNGLVLLCCPTCKSETNSGYTGIGPAEYAVG
jgi:hypothetical protein